ncbi:MAG: peptide-methionine (R)-S-oxide reductase MsrB [Commensalibacter sp.]|nr:peptide-methionine (R)-S-oxide reductase MsrB [Commensalibacter sp.]
MKSNINNQWSQHLSSEQLRVMRDHGTETPGSSPLNYEKRTGAYYCANCHAELFRSETKYDSGCGWPSFFAPIKGAVESSLDTSHHMIRTEIHCAKCKAHLGHVFDDGIEPTGERYCINGVALDFKPQS